MRRLARIIIALIASLPLLSPAAFAQQDDNGLLYFPPELTVSCKKIPAECGGICLTDITSEEEIIPLPVLFFDDPGSALLPERYRMFARPAEADPYFPAGSVRQWEGTFAKYYELPNIIGFRLRENPQATISLEGGYSVEPGESPEVGRERAQGVKDYLVNIWKIAPERIALREPRQGCDSSAGFLLRQEARRVLFHSDNAEIFAPLRYEVHARYGRHLMMDVTVNPRMNPEEVLAIEVTAFLGDSLLSKSVLKGSPEAERYRLHCRWIVDGRMTLATNGPLTIRARVQRNDGTYRETAVQSIPLFINRRENRPAERTLEIPFFPYAGNDLSPFHTALIDRYIPENAKEGSDILVIGGGDALESPGNRMRGLPVAATRSGRDDNDPWRTYRDSMETLFTGIENGSAQYIVFYPDVDWCANTQVAEADSLLSVKRGEEVGGYIARHFRGVSVRTERSLYTNAEIPRYPEERCYGRSVTLRLEEREGVEEIESP